MNLWHQLAKAIIQMKNDVDRMSKMPGSVVSLLVMSDKIRSIRHQCDQCEKLIALIKEEEA